MDGGEELHGVTGSAPGRSPADHGRARKAFEYLHVVSFEETNVVGNVYYSRHISWQGRCRELFLRQEVPQVIDELRKDLRLVTTSCSCTYFRELQVFDEVTIMMRLAYLRQNRIGLDFHYYVDGHLVAQGFQEIGCMFATDQGTLQPGEPPRAITQALLAYGAQRSGPVETADASTLEHALSTSPTAGPMTAGPDG